MQEKEMRDKASQIVHALFCKGIDGPGMTSSTKVRPMYLLDIPYSDIYSKNVRSTGSLERRLEQQNTQRVGDVTDEQKRIRFGLARTEEIGKTTRLK